MPHLLYSDLPVNSQPHERVRAIADEFRTMLATGELTAPDRDGRQIVDDMLFRLTAISFELRPRTRVHLVSIDPPMVVYEEAEA